MSCSEDRATGAQRCVYGERPMVDAGFAAVVRSRRQPIAAWVADA
ncbi:hypothetical protein [Rubneribacter badeniensis]|nr:hypothetical protein [Rubneribacter badeniensis]